LSKGAIIVARIGRVSPNSTGNISQERRGIGRSTHAQTR
jgi:hypothetical protein